MLYYTGYSNIILHLTDNLNSEKKIHFTTTGINLHVKAKKGIMGDITSFLRPGGG